MAPEDLTPADRERAQDVIVRLYLARRLRQPGRRRTDLPLPASCRSDGQRARFVQGIRMQRFDLAGREVHQP